MHTGEVKCLKAIAVAFFLFSNSFCDLKIVDTLLVSRGRYGIIGYEYGLHKNHNLFSFSQYKLPNSTSKFSVNLLPFTWTFDFDDEFDISLNPIFTFLYGSLALTTELGCCEEGLLYYGRSTTIPSLFILPQILTNWDLGYDISRLFFFVGQRTNYYWAREFIKAETSAGTYVDLGPVDLNARVAFPWKLDPGDIEPRFYFGLHLGGVDKAVYKKP